MAVMSVIVPARRPTVEGRGLRTSKYGKNQGGAAVMSATEDFFRVQAGRSLAKSEIVSKYFAAWANIIGAHAERIAYVDLFCGPGTYEDGARSTPLLVLDKACQNERVRRQLVSLFNDSDSEIADALKANVGCFPDGRGLAHTPEFDSKKVAHGTLARYAARLGETPTLLFLDPWGYKGLSLEEIERFIGPWGSECIFFFNYRRVNAALSNQVLSGPVTALFGDQVASDLRRRLQDETASQRERLVLEELRSSLTRLYGKYVLWFRLAGPDQAANYYLVHVTKGWTGYEVMRDIMDHQSSSRDAFDVSSFEYNPSGQSSMFRLAGSLPELEESLVNDYASQTRTAQDIFRQHSEGRMFVRRNYRHALLRLEAAGRVKCEPGKRPSGTLAPRVRVTFMAMKEGSGG